MYHNKSIYLNSNGYITDNNGFKPLVDLKVYKNDTIFLKFYINDTSVDYTNYDFQGGISDTMVYPATAIIDLPSNTFNLSAEIADNFTDFNPVSNMCVTFNTSASTLNTYIGTNSYKDLAIVIWAYNPEPVLLTQLPIRVVNII